MRFVPGGILRREMSAQDDAFTFQCFEGGFGLTFRNAELLRDFSRGCGAADFDQPADHRQSGVNRTEVTAYALRRADAWGQVCSRKRGHGGGKSFRGDPKTATIGPPERRRPLLFGQIVA